MKIINRVVAALMIALLMVTSVPWVEFSAKAVSCEKEVYTLTLEATIADSFAAKSGAVGGASSFRYTAFDGCYGNQLSGVAREIYDSLVKNYVTNKKTSMYTYTLKAPYTFDAEISGGSIVMNNELKEISAEIDCALQAAMDAFLYDHPEVYWLKSVSSSYNISASSNANSGYVGKIQALTITPAEIYIGASTKLLQYTSAVESALDSINVSQSRYDTLKSIHDYICNNAWYNLVSEQRVHSSDPFFIGDGGVVCEGYAKSFKIFCDRLDIPCVLVVGDADGDHMWNYVQMDDKKWYLVDVTWDDQSGRICDTYFIANANTIGFNGVAISEERSESTYFSDARGFSFTYPVLSTTAYNAHVHVWESDYTVDVQPTCTENGSMSIHCVSCDATKNRTELPATNHVNKKEYAQQDATCAQKGYTAGVYCSDCDEWIKGHKEIDALPHIPTAPIIENRVEPQCDTKGGYAEVVYCSVCNTELSRTEKEINAIGHDNKTTITKATLTKNGKVENECSVCGKVSKTTIYYPKTIALSATSYIYNGKRKTPSVTVKDRNGSVLKKNVDYTVTYESGRMAPGKYTVTIRFKGNYSGTKKLYFTIAPNAPTKLKASQTTTTITLSWARVTGATGYRVYMYNSKTKKYEALEDVTATKLKINKLKAGTKYKLKVKAYTKDGSTIWSAASSVLATATKTKTPSIKSLESTAKGKAVIKWSDVSGESGYQVYYSTSKNGTYKKLASYSANKATGSKSKLKSGKKYYFKVRAYTKTDSGTVYSAWSSVKGVKVK